MALYTIYRVCLIRVSLRCEVWSRFNDKLHPTAALQPAIACVFVLVSDFHQIKLPMIIMEVNSYDITDIDLASEKHFHSLDFWSS